MRKMRLIKLAMCMAFLGLATCAARGSVSANVIKLGTDPVDSFGDQATGFTAYLIRLVTNDGALITGVDAGGTAGSVNGIFGPILQSWDVGRVSNTPTPVEPDQFAPAPYTVDSHILIPAAVRADAAAPAEDNTLVRPPGSPPNNPFSVYGTGTQLTGTFGIKSDQATSLDLAYILLPNNTTAAFSFDISDSNATATHVAGLVPEPSTFAVFSAGFGLLLRRRR